MQKPIHMQYRTIHSYTWGYTMGIIHLKLWIPIFFTSSQFLAAENIRDFGPLNWPKLSVQCVQWPTPPSWMANSPCFNGEVFKLVKTLASSPGEASWKVDVKNPPVLKGKILPVFGTEKKKSPSFWRVTSFVHLHVRFWWICHYFRKVTSPVLNGSIPQFQFMAKIC